MWVPICWVAVTCSTTQLTLLRPQPSPPGVGAAPVDVVGVGREVLPERAAGERRDVGVQHVGQVETRPRRTSRTASSTLAGVISFSAPASSSAP